MVSTTLFHYPLTAEVDGLLLPAAPDGRARFSREAYHRLGEIGILGRDSRVELIDGEILMMSPIGPLHGAIVRRLTHFFVKNLPDSIECSIQLPISSGDHSEPEPDIALVRRREDDYQVKHPAPDDVLLLIEVAQSSVSYDLGKKLLVYAESHIPEYWVIDIGKKIVITHSEPAGSAYNLVKSFSAGSMIAPLAAPNCQLDLTWLFR
jgi:Uma2 family endonuclease